MSFCKMTLENVLVGLSQRKIHSHKNAKILSEQPEITKVHALSALHFQAAERKERANLGPTALSIKFSHLHPNMLEAERGLSD